MLAHPMVASPNQDRRISALFLRYDGALPSDKMWLASSIERALRATHQPQLNARLGRIDALLWLIDTEHIDELDAEVRALRREVDRTQTSATSA